MAKLRRKTQKTKSGSYRYYLYRGKKKVKNLPKKYANIPIEQIEGCLIDEESLVLSPAEKLALLGVIWEKKFYAELEKFKDSLKKSYERADNLIYDEIKDSKVVEMYRVKPKDGAEYVEAKFESGYKVRVPKKLYREYISSDLLNDYLINRNY